MKKIEVTNATQPLAAFAREVGEEPLVVTDKGKPVAMLVNLRGSDWETVSLSLNSKFMEIIEDSRRQLERRAIPLAEVRSRLGVKSKNRTSAKSAVTRQT